MSEYDDYYEKDGIKINAVVKPVNSVVESPIEDYLRAEKRLKIHIREMSKDELRLLSQIICMLYSYVDSYVNMKEDLNNGKT